MAKVDIDFVIRLERKNDSHTISNKIFDFSETTIRQPINDWYEQTKPQMNVFLAESELVALAVVVVIRIALSWSLS